MNLYLLVVLGFVAILLLYSLLRYVREARLRLIEARERCHKNWSDIEVLIERQHSELQQLGDLTNEHVSHETALLETILEKNGKRIKTKTPEAAAEFINSLREASDEIHSLAEEYPELASADRFEELSESIVDLEQRLENRREQYNAAVAAYNARLQSFPESYFADQLGYSRREPFEASERAQEEVELRDRLDVTTRD
ncbi:LemA family protein [Halorhabdus salina]|uniref:LemA family protein n=1 Tax=Halorhabdus salina TaxID=2750670 RepID=UPI0015EFD480|nr:LemA family protein [Halorhabdus salina]